MTSLPVCELSLPAPKLDHLLRLTDETGIIQHALGPLPLRSTGYTSDDNARALRVALQAASAGWQAQELAQTYLAFLAFAQRPDGRFHNFFDYQRHPLVEEPSEDCHARCLWALAEAAWSEEIRYLRWTAVELFRKGLPPCTGFRSTRGWAGVAIAAAAWLDGRWDGDEGDLPAEDLPDAEVEGVLKDMTQRLTTAWQQTRSNGWAWFEDIMTYDNALLPYALLRASRVTGDRKMRQIGLDALGFLAEATFRGDTFWPIGNNGWWHRDGHRAEFAQQPLEAGSMVLACIEAWDITGDVAWLQRARKAAAWFIGDNALGLWLYDPETGGCRDGLEADGVNHNQGAESTLAWLTAALSIQHLPGVRVEEWMCA